MRRIICLLHVFGVIIFLTSGTHAANRKTIDEAETILKNAEVPVTDEGLLLFFRERAFKGDIQTIEHMARNLGHRSYQLREKASKILKSLGASSIPVLLQASRSTDLEVRRRAEYCLQSIHEQSQSGLVAAAAQCLAQRKPEGGVEAMLNALPTILGDEAIEAIHQSLADLALIDKEKPHAALVKGLDSKLSAIRAGAVVALCRAGVKKYFPKIRILLKEPDPFARLRIALALAQQHEKEAIPVLINLFGELSQGQLWQVEDLLYQLAKEKAPGLAHGSDPTQVKKFRDAWLGWWAAYGEKMDLKTRMKKTGVQGYTLVVMLDESKVIDLDKDNKPRFIVNNVDFPLDIELLSGERLLLAEHGANKVRERHRNGTILWEYPITEPLVAQRLDHGRTFIAAKEQLVIVDRQGNVEFSYSRPNSETFSRARHLPNGDIICVTTYSRFYHLSPTKQIKRSFSANVHTSGGRIDLLPNGNVLIPEMYNDQVVEFSPTGNRVNLLRVEQPIVARRLANGHTLVTCMEQKRAVELDKNNKEVWQYVGKTRVTRAIRH